jgi:murein DD-endopeptidase MepM/ murein hydrolase activator NlpD
MSFRRDPLTWQVVIGIDLDVKPGTYPIAIAIERPTGPERLEHPVTVAAKPFPTRRLTVDGAYVDPPSDVQARIVEEARLLTSIWSASAPERLWTGAFVPPVPHEANSAFGTRSIFNGQARSPHGGADFLSPARTPVAAPNGGRVVLARDLYYTGGTVVVDHGLGLVSLFAHLSRIDVRVGDAVTAGQALGLVGSTGRVTGPHLHWTLRLGGTRVDPLSLLAVLGR